MTVGVIFTITNTVTPLKYHQLQLPWPPSYLTTWAVQEPRVRCSGVKSSPTIV